MSQQPPGTFLPNTKVTVGSHKVVIEKYLSEGGFAHVYVVRVPRDNHKHEVAVLKRVAVPDKEHLANMRTEVETMKKLKGHKHIVTYYDSHASQLKGGGYEVFLLMEYCNGGGLIDFMNTRLQHRLTEPEILKIFGDVSEGVATMHYLKPPLLHRDLKVENVLISTLSGSPIYKVCDFGSTAPPRPAASTVEEGRLIEDDIQKHTTMQYRSPEMIDVWRKHPIDEKADIWALGVLLYKLCYYTTPFEDVGQMAILNASYKYPSYPQFSDRLKKFIAWMLKEDPRNRPNIYQVVKEVCSMRGKEPPIKDIYANRTQSEARRNETLPSPDPPSPAPVGLQKAIPQVQVQAIPDIAPMRRGRPTGPVGQTSTSAKPTPSPARDDPFAALDSKNYAVRAGAVDELSKRFPSVDEFSIAHDGGKFSFPNSSPAEKPPEAGASLNERVANALADEVFSRSGSHTPAAPSKETPPQPVKLPPPKVIQTRETELGSARQSNVSHSSNAYKSTGTGTSPPLPTTKKSAEVNNRPIWRVPQHERSTSQPRASEEAQAAAALLQPSLPPTKRPALLAIHRSKSQTSTVAIQGPGPSKQSLEIQRPAMSEALNSGLARSGSVNSAHRPSSMFVSSNMDFLRDQESSRKRTSLEIRRPHRPQSRSRESEIEEGNISDDMQFLRNTEETDTDRKRSNRPSHHRKSSGFNPLSGAKHIITGRFGDAFKRFEHHHTGEKKDQNLAPRTPEPHDLDTPQLLSPIAGSEATQSRHSDMESTIDETEDLPPEVRRELERKRLVEEEQRVAEAAAEYRARVALHGTGVTAAPTKASMIQGRVQSLLDERRDAPAPRKTAEGYGKYTDSSEVVSIPLSQAGKPIPGGGMPPLSNKTTSTSSAPASVRSQHPRQSMESPSMNPISPPLSAQTQEAPLQRVISRPSAPPKPQALRTGGKSHWPPPHPPDIQKPLPAKPSGLAALLAKDLEGVPDYPPATANSAQPSNITSAPLTGGEDLEADFSKRYPSLSGIEMVETEIKSGGPDVTRVREM